MNNRTWYLRMLAAAAFVLAGCSSNSTTPPTASALGTNSYVYTAFDAGGTPVATGTVTLSFEGTAVTGLRDIKGTAPEAGTGAISGVERPDGTVEITLNPGGAAVVLLEGKFQGADASGSRLLDTGDPPMNRTIGTFTITLPSVHTQ